VESDTQIGGVTMYLGFLVDIPDVKGKITQKRKGNSVYISYEIGRKYDPAKQYNVPDRVIIGKQNQSDKKQMEPNENFLKYFPEVDLPEERYDSNRSSCLRIGAYIIIQQMMKETGIPELLSEYFNDRDLGLFLDLITYTLICENNAGQYYPDYAYNHPLFTEGMRIYSDATVSDFFGRVTDDQSIGFLNEWNAKRDHREKIYISYDSTNKNIQAGDVEIAEFGNAKVDTGKPIFNYSIAYDTHNREPLFYEKYPGSINDVSQLQIMLDKAMGYGYRKIGFILDRGYFSKANLDYMDHCGYDFVVMVKGMSTLVNELILENKGKFEDKRACSIRRHKVYGTTVKRKLFLTDEKERYFHIFHSSGKETKERENVEKAVENCAYFLEKKKGSVYEVPNYLQYYFEPEYSKDGYFLMAREKRDVIERELRLCGYFVIITSQKMTAGEAIDLYRSRDASEKLFRGDKSYLGNKSIRVYSDESVSAKIFIEFVALIIRNRIYTKLRDEVERLGKDPNFMTVPAAIKELEKIEIIRGLDLVYRLDHAVTATQKTILSAFDMDVKYVQDKAKRISEQIRNTIGNEG
jgi:transposase, IS4 family